jgi:hypothetical protein
LRLKTHAKVFSIKRHGRFSKISLSQLNKAAIRFLPVDFFVVVT